VDDLGADARPGLNLEPPSALRFSALGVPLALAAMLAGLGTIALIGPS
jgi:hypothetical protein